MTVDACTRGGEGRFMEGSADCDSRKHLILDELDLLRPLLRAPLDGASFVATGHAHLLVAADESHRQVLKIQRKELKLHDLLKGADEFPHEAYNGWALWVGKLGVVDAVPRLLVLLGEQVVKVEPRRPAADRGLLGVLGSLARRREVAEQLSCVEVRASSVDQNVSPRAVA